MALLQIQDIQINQQILNFQIEQGEILAIVGANGSGKSTLAKQLTGKQWLKTGSIKRNLPLDQIIYTDFTADNLNFQYQNFYYQQRYHASEEDYGKTIRQYLQFEENNSFHQFLLNRIFPLNELDREMIKLSSGETRKILIIKTLINDTQLYILDNPFTGLDNASIEIIRNLLFELTQQYAKTLIILLNDIKNVPEYVQQIIHLANNTAISQGKKISQIEQLNQGFQNPAFANVFEIRNAQIFAGKQLLLQNLNWTVKKGEKWLLRGANGSGKSTLLSLLYADNPKAYSYDLHLFDRPRGSGESIWDIKKQIGFISPEIQLYWNGSENVRKIILSGFMDAFVPNRKISEVEIVNYELVMESLDLKSLEEKNILSLSTGEKRMVMLARALVKNPPVLVIDEPFQGLDEMHKQLMYTVLEILANEQRTLIQVAHLESEILTCITKNAIIIEGKLLLNH